MKYRNDYHSGFTLIELLVVISIIALMSSVVLAAVSSANKKAKDAAIKQLALQMRNVYELEYSKSGNYTSLLPPVTGIPTTWTTFTSGYVCKNLSATDYSCLVTTVVGCDNLNSLAGGPTIAGYVTGGEANKICKDIINKTASWFYYGVSSGASRGNEYAIWIEYPSDVGNGFCLRSGGGVSAKTTQSVCTKMDGPLQ